MVLLSASVARAFHESSDEEDQPITAAQRVAMRAHLKKVACDVGFNHQLQARPATNYEAVSSSAGNNGADRGGTSNTGINKFTPSEERLSVRFGRVG
jgi:hypothetical protein